jgi:hypothetical protein
MNNDYIYWTFSSAAQSISAFIALLLAGYALVHNLMEAARERDDTLEEIHSELRLSYHKRLTALAWLTGSAVILSLVVVYLNRSTVPVSDWALLVVGCLDILAVIGGVAFVVSIVDPRKYQKAAEKALEQAQVIVSGIPQATPAAEFFDAFLHLERLIRDYLKEKDLYVPSRGAPRMSYSFRQMIEALLQNELIDRQFMNELLEINKYRNLVFHGHVGSADQSMVQRVRAATERLRGIL